MATKKVYFYKYKLKKNGKAVGSDRAEEIFKATIESYWNAQKSLPLEVSDNEKVTMDQIEFDPGTIFARLGREQDLSALAIRTENREGKSISFSQWIDKLTYFFIDFDLELLVVVNNQSAPRAKNVCHLFTKYNKLYEMSLASIPNDKYYRSLYNKKATINKIRIKMPVPNVEELQTIPGFSEKQLKKIKDLDVGFFDIELKANPRGVLTSKKNEIKEIIHILEDNISEYEKCEVDGRISGTSKHTFDLKDEFFSFQINIDHKKTQAHTKVYKLPVELSNEYREKLRKLVKDNRDFLGKFDK